jgi:hypothetical protein
MRDASRVDRKREVDEQVVRSGEPTARAVAPSMATMVEADDTPATGVEKGGHVTIAAHVLAQAVNEDNRSPRLCEWPLAAAQVNPSRVSTCLLLSTPSSSAP